MAIGPDERALLAVAREDLPANFSRDARRDLFTCSRTRLAPRAFQLPQAPALEILEEQVQRALHYIRDLPAGIGVAHQVSRTFQLFPKRGTGGELDPEAAL